jgi:hypothetical protein
VLAPIALKLALAVAAPERVAVLALDAAESLPDVAALRENFLLAVQEEVGLPVIPGGAAARLVTLLGCAGRDPECFGKVALTLDVRFVIYGEARQDGSRFKLRVALFDAGAAADLATAEEAISAADDRPAMRGLVAALLAAEAAAPLRRPAAGLSPKRLLPALGLAALGAGFGVGALVLRDSLRDDAANLADPARSTRLRRLGLAFALTADLSAIGSLAAFGLALKPPKRERAAPPKSATAGR